MSRLVQGRNYDEDAEGDMSIVSMGEFMSMQTGHKAPAEAIVPESTGPVAYESKQPIPQEDEESDAQQENDGKGKGLKAVGILKNKDVKKLMVVAGGIILLLVAFIAISKMLSGGEEKPAEEDEYIPPWMDDDYAAPVFSYTAAEVAELRLNGYTGREIENYEAVETPASILIEQATKARKELYEREIAPYMDSASEEYKNLASNSWVGQDELKFSKDVNGYSYYTDVMNVDYSKIPARGMQLYVKLVTAKGSVMFMNVTPEQYVRLSDSGNIVVRVEYTKTSDGAVIVTSLTEVNITQ